MSESHQLFNRYINNQCCAEEVEALMMYFHTDQREELSLLVLLELERSDTSPDDENYENLLNDIYIDIQNKIRSNRKTIRPIRLRIAAAASILLILSFGGYFLFHKQHAEQIVKNQKTDIRPGGNKAILTLSNGQQIVLNNAKNTKLPQQGNAIINKNASGQIIYSNNGEDNKTEVAYNILTTPRGGRFELTLSDGTKITLNAASSIRYPVNFEGSERRVEITGEAYFEVAHNKAKPFVVTTKGQTVQVLGTHFNINAYNDEPVIKTTLLEGKIKISKQEQTALLSPGQQAEINLTGNIKVISNADVEQAMAWKNGYFQFNNADLFTVMRQLSRWYNVDVAYESDVPKRIFSGKIHRNLNASESLQMLQYFKVNYKIIGREILISK